MINGYERASKEIIPTARLLIAKELKERYNMTESRIADILGVAQAAVSKYLNGNYSDSIARLSERIDKKQLDKYIAAIAEGKQNDIHNYMCSICSTMNKFDCKFSSIKVAKA